MKDDPEYLLSEIGEILRMVERLGSDIDAGHQMHVGKRPWQTEKGPRMTLRSTRERLRHIACRAAAVFEPNTELRNAGDGDPAQTL